MELIMGLFMLAVNLLLLLVIIKAAINSSDVSIDIMKMNKELQEIKELLKAQVKDEKTDEQLPSE